MGGGADRSTHEHSVDDVGSVDSCSEDLEKNSYNIASVLRRNKQSDTPVKELYSRELIRTISFNSSN